MKLPFIEQVPEFHPRKRPGVDPKLRPFEREVLDAIDVLEQREDFSTRVAIRNHNVMLVLIVINVVINGAQILGMVQKWAGDPIKPTPTKITSR